MTKEYKIRDWYWEVSNQSPTTQVYSTAAKSYVLKTDAAYVSFVSDGTEPSKILNQSELYDLLISTYEDGLPDSVRLRGVRPYDIVAALTQAQYTALIARLGGATSKAFGMFLTIDRVDVTTGSPLRNALNAVAGFDINDLQLANRLERWSNDH